MENKEEVIEKNKKLIDEYPFLLPRNRWTGRVSDNYDYSYTELDIAEVSDAWREKLLVPMFKEIKKELERAEACRTEETAERKRFSRCYAGTNDAENNDYLHVWAITQIKEKWGALRVYSNFSSKELNAIISKYSKKSERTCWKCGKTAKVVSQGYILPFCEECSKEETGPFIPINEWLK